MGEHHSSGWSTLSAPDLLIAALARETRRIRFATGVIPLPYHHGNIRPRLAALADAKYREQVIRHPAQHAGRHPAGSLAAAGSIEQLWASDGVHLLMPPQEVVAAADDLGLVPTFQASGHVELEVRVRRTYEEFVADGKCTFRRRGDVARVRDAGGRIRTDYQFIEPPR